jgi:hypothetical protein
MPTTTTDEVAPTKQLDTAVTDAVSDSDDSRRRQLRPVRRARGRRRGAEVIDDPWTKPGQWYVVHTQSGYEKKVTANLTLASRA